MTVLEAAKRMGVDHLIGDEEVIQRVLGGETNLYELIMRRYNRRLYRVIRSILVNDSEVEPVMQDTYVAAFTHLEQFAGRSKFSTWLTKIAVHEALSRRRQRNRFVDLDSITESEKEHSDMLASKDKNPEERLLDMELKAILDHSVESLPELYRSVFVMRDIEGMDTAETADSLGISEENVKTRLHRARTLIRGTLFKRTESTLGRVFDFHLSRCDCVVAAVLEQIKKKGCRLPKSDTAVLGPFPAG
jgi:RNA polymerase sigma-70 factor, ECF subfamily